MSVPIFEFSDHAKMRLKDRGISRAQVKLCILKGYSVGLDVCGRIVKRTNIGKKSLVVVYIRTASSFIIVTAYWV